MTSVVSIGEDFKEKRRGRRGEEGPPSPDWVGAPSGQLPSLPALQNLRPDQAGRPTGLSTPSLTHRNEARTQPGWEMERPKPRPREMSLIG